MVFLVLSSLAEYSYEQPEIHLERVKIISNKLVILTSKYPNTQISISRQKEIQKLFEKDVFQVVIPNKVVIPKRISSSTQVFNSCFVDRIKDLCTDKAYEKDCLVVYTYNDKEKDLVLINSRKILCVS